MACRGVHFALTEEDAARLLAAEQDEDVLAVIEDIEERWDTDHLAETDKAWDAIHRCLADGRLTHDGGSYPLSYAVLGGLPLHDGDDHVVVHVTAAEVADIAAAMADLDDAWLRERFFALDPEDYDGARDEDDFAYTRHWFGGLRAFYATAAANGRSVVFTVDQ
ncbi:DUF1877 family protein [Kitasatospora sp. NPDC051914]|uniref:DUF1877 family protein n=1 Tax=Kitasatospora sp. NPDC051914 TaxID=3154945 RepID=UPI00341A87F4